MDYGSQCAALWHPMDWLLRVDVAVLGLLLACTLVLLVKIPRCYRLARHSGVDCPVRRGFVAELKVHVGNLNSMASTAPYLGLLGTCLGILSAFSGVGMERHAYVAWVTSKVAAALVPCAAGIIVAVPATCAHVYGCTRLDLLVNELPCRNRLLTRRFTEFPQFGLIIAWLLAILLRVWVIPFTPVQNSRGLEVGIATVPCDTSERFIVLQISNRGGIFLNLEQEQDWGTLQSRLSEIFRMRASRVLYLSAEEGVPFQTVADAIDTVKNSPEDITVRLVTPSGIAGCPEPRLVGSSTRQRSR
jgi:biopolymer transport protein ExbD